MSAFEYRKKGLKKYQKKEAEPVTHVVFVHEDGKFISSTNPISVADCQRITRLSHVAAAMPAVIAVLIIDKNDDVLYTMQGKVHNRAQFDIFVEETLKAKAKSDAEKAKETVDA